jgi:hypothetical protein
MPSMLPKGYLIVKRKRKKKRKKKGLGEVPEVKSVALERKESCHCIEAIKQTHHWGLTKRETVKGKVETSGHSRRNMQAIITLNLEKKERNEMRQCVFRIEKPPNKVVDFKMESVSPVKIYPDPDE